EEEITTISNLLLPENYTLLNNTKAFSHYFHSVRNESFYDHDFNIKYSDTNKIFKLALMYYYYDDEILVDHPYFEIIEDEII
ncbi:hypothetical protein ACI3PL_29195, partial [Lacticaseibacillus paracasei]